MVAVNISFDLDDLPSPEISDDAVTDWLSARLNDARNLFIQRVSRGGGSGRTYRRGHGRTHRASSPGEYPATDQGGLVTNVAWVVYSAREGVLYCDLKYAKYLTEGTVHMGARRMLDDVLREVLENRPASDRLASAARLS